MRWPRSALPHWGPGPRRALRVNVLVERTMRSPYTAPTLELLEAKMAEHPFRGTTLERDGESVVRVAALGRGELLFYQRDARCTLIEIDMHVGGFSMRRARRWHDGAKIDGRSRDAIVEDVTEWMRSLGYDEVRVAR